MTLPPDRILPFRPTQIEAGGSELTEYMRDLVSTLEESYTDSVDNIDGRIQEYTPVLTGATLSGTGTYTTQVGLSLRQGIRVWTWFYVDWSAHTGAGDLTISLPYRVKTTTQNVFTGAIALSSVAWPAGTTSPITQAISNTLTAKVLHSGSATPYAYLQLPASGIVVGSLFYIGQEDS